MKKNFIFVCGLIMLWASYNYAQPRNQIFTGARPLGLGESFVAIADDGNAIYWNPAGLPTLRRPELHSMYVNNLYNVPGLHNLYLSFAYPLTSRYAVGGSWFNYGYDEQGNELEYFLNHLNIAFGAKLPKNLFLGANVKYLNTDTRLDGRSEGKGSGFGFDLGALYSLPFKKGGFLQRLNFGVMAFDVGGTYIKYDATDRRDKILPQNIRFGAALYPKEEISLKWFSLRDALLTVDVDDRFHAGAETWLNDNLAIRGGMQKDFHTDEGATFSVGGSLKFAPLALQMDYAYVMPPTLSPTHLFSLSFIPSVSPVKISDINLNDVYASFYKSYATARIGAVTIRNDYDQELKMTLKVTIPGLTESVSQESFVLGPDESKTTAFPVIFAKNILSVREPAFRQAKIRVEYKIKNEDKAVEASEKFRLFGRGAITWEDPGKAAAFITKLDRMVELFAREATKELPYRPEVELGNLYTAAALFDAMSAISIKYREDPENPFSIIPKSQHRVDYIKYPAELLASKQGDCDDLTVLYASLLENAGIKTALVSTAGHIFLMFDTGIHERNWGLLPVGDSLVVAKDHSLWIPVEVTEIGKSFAEAWQVGGKKYREAEPDDEFKVVAVKEVEGVYVSALPEELQTQVPDLPNPDRLNKMLTADATWIQQRRSTAAVEKYLAALRLRGEANDSLRNQLGIIFAQQDSLRSAEYQFKKILDTNPNDPRALVNLANVYCVSGRFQEAEAYYLKAESPMASQPGFYLNLALLYQMWKTEHADSAALQQKSEMYLLEAFKLLNGAEAAALNLLGILAEDTDLGEKADLTAWVKKQSAGLKKFIRDSGQKYLFNKSVKGTRLERKAVKRGPDKDRSYILWWA